jgi:hypothetical protein
LDTLQRAPFRTISIIGCVALLPLFFGMARSPETSKEIPHSEAVTGILKILDSVPLVAIGDIHSVAEQGEFYQKLIRHPQFPQKVNDLILELGNELYQNVADRYVAGEPVPIDSVRMIWENTTQGPLLTATAPMYTTLFNAVREVNAKLPPSRRVRIILGDPAVEWRTVTRDELWEIHKRRGDRLREVARDSVIAKGRRGIIIAGFRHLNRRPDANGTDAKWGDLDKKVFVIRPHNGFGGPVAQHETAIDSLPPGSLIRLRDTFIGDLLSDDVDMRTSTPARQPIPEGLKSVNAGLTLKQIADGYLYIAPFKTLTTSAPDIDRIRRDPARLAAIQTRSCLMVGRAMDTTMLYRVPSRLMYPSGQRPSTLDLDPVEPRPASPPPLPATLPEPCDSLLRARALP